MKKFKYIILLALFFYFPLYSNEVVAKRSSIKELIFQVQNAPDEQKRVLMNQLKIQLKEMNTQTRKETMQKLKKSFSKSRVQGQGEHPRSQELSTTCNHQPKFRHLRQGLQDGSIHTQGQNIGVGHQGNGHK